MVGLTPRNWAALYVSPGNVRDGIREDVAIFGSQAVGESYDDEAMASHLDQLPYVTHAMDETWRLRLTQAAEDLRIDMDNGRWPLPRNVGEEAVRHLAYCAHTTPDGDALTDPGITPDATPQG